MNLDRMEVDIILEVGDFFGGDTDKTTLWLNTANLNLGGQKPVDMMKIGRTKKLWQFVTTALRENER